MVLSKERVEELKPILENKDLNDAFKKAETVEDVQNIFAQNGVEISKEEVESLLEEIAGHSGELSEENLDSVAGGGILLGLAIYGGALIVTDVICYVAGRIVGKKAKCG